MTVTHTADYVVIGGGSAACIVAGRLAEHGYSVLLLEAGESAEAHPETLTADGFKYAFANDATMWPRMSSPLPAMGRKYLGTGRGMGGSGSVNGMVYTRGDKHDFLTWPAGWQWDDVLPAFEAIEAKLQPRPRPPTAMVQRFIQACTSLGMREETGLNTGNLSGKVGANDMNYAGEQRRSSYRAFIQEFLAAQPAAAQRLHIITGAQVERIEFAGQTATAVHYRKDGRAAQATVGKEVILTAGALETPRLLMLSGVGEAAHLQSLGLPVVCDAPGVGLHLQDHPNVSLFWRGQQPLDFAYPQVYAFDQAERVAPAAAPFSTHANTDNDTDFAPDTCWVFYAASGSIQQAMHRMLPIMALPGGLHQITWLRQSLRGLIDLAFALPPVQRFVANIFGIVVILGKPSARGSIRLASAAATDAADIQPGWYGSAQDKARMEAGIRKALQMVQQPSLAQLAPRPLSAAAKPGITPDKLWQWIHKASMTTYHFGGSCRMGDDALSPVDPQTLRVKGLRNVRVADASVMPEIPVSALNAPSMMIGWRAAEMIVQSQPPNSSQQQQKNSL